ncbi:hypothetical protein [Streptomyces sp. NBC_00829]|uniref:hypothetical protein n=1 Tax=Streptomyces sp. NBC_00829 TaxID=2903679 RepID=UPI00386A51B8|nr:hypothetical protein OG293_27850 [Streptomyces sp. NBC_00829]
MPRDRGRLDLREDFREALAPFMDTETSYPAVTAVLTAALRHLELAYRRGLMAGKSQAGYQTPFRRPQDAWDFYRGPTRRETEPMNLLQPPPAHIAEAVARWTPGLWAEEHHTPRP